MRLAVLLPIGSARPESAALSGALSLAVQDINSRPEILRGRRLEYVWMDDSCGRSKSLARFNEMLERFGPIDCLIGAGCDESCEGTAPLAEVLRIPQISPMCRAASLSNKLEFPLFTRTTSPYTKWAPAMVALMQWAAWARVSIIGDVTMAANVWAFRSEVERSGLKLGAEVQFRADRVEATPGHPSTVLSAVQMAGVRIVMALALGPDDYLALAVGARKLEMVKGWAWMGLDLVSGAEQSARGAALASAQEALVGWICFAPHSAADGTFFDRVEAASTADLRRHVRNTTRANSYAANLYDAVMLYAMVAGAHLGKRPDAELIAQTLKNTSFEGMTGRVDLDGNGDMTESIQTMNFVIGPDGAVHGRPMGIYDAVSGRYSPLLNYTVVWPGGMDAAPTDIPQTNLNETIARRFNTVWLFVGAMVAAALLMGGLILLIWKKQAKLQAILMMLFAETSEIVGTVLLDVADVVTDGFTVVRILRGEVQAATQGYQAAYTTVFAFGVVGVVVSVTYRVRSALLVRDRVRALVLREGREEMSELRVKVERHEWELAQTHRTKVWLLLALMTIGVQGTFAWRLPLLCADLCPRPLARQIYRPQSSAAV